MITHTKNTIAQIGVKNRNEIKQMKSKSNKFTINLPNKQSNAILQTNGPEIAQEWHKR